MREARFIAVGVLSGGYWARFFTAPDTLIAYVVAWVTFWGLVEAVAFLGRHLRWKG
jgi:hypothetical protein